MANSFVLTLAVVTCVIAVPCGTAEEVEVIVESANVKVGEEVVGSVKRGDRLQVVNRRHPWICVRLNRDDGDLEGWVLCTKVRIFVEPGVDEESAAPPPFGDVHASVNGTYSVVSRPQALFLELSLHNDGIEAVSYDAAQIVLEVAGKLLKSLPPTAPESISGYPSVRMLDHVRTIRIQPLRQRQD